MAEQIEEPVTAKFMQFTPEEMPEAGGVSFAVLRGARTENGVTSVCEVNLTGRGRNSLEALDNLIEGIKYAKEKYHLTAWREIASVPQHPTIPSAIVPPVNNTATTNAASLPGAVETTTNQPAQTPQPAGDNGSQLFHADKMVIKPRADGKTLIEFWGANRKFADVSQVWTFENAVKNLQSLGAFTLQHVQTLSEYPISANICFVFSDKKNTAGNPYKNVTVITKA